MNLLWSWKNHVLYILHKPNRARGRARGRYWLRRSWLPEQYNILVSYKYSLEDNRTLISSKGFLWPIRNRVRFLSRSVLDNSTQDQERVSYTTFLGSYHSHGVYRGISLHNQGAPKRTWEGEGDVNAAFIPPAVPRLSSRSHDAGFNRR